MAGRAAAGAGNGRGPQQAVWRGTAVLRRRWPPSTCQGAAPCGLRLFAGGGGWCCYGAETHAMRSVTACNRRPPSSTSSSTSGLSRPVLPRQLWRVVGWVGFLSGVERVHINIGTWGLCDRLWVVPNRNRVWSLGLQLFGQFSRSFRASFLDFVNPQQRTSFVQLCNKGTAVKALPNARRGSCVIAPCIGGRAGRGRDGAVRPQ